MNLLGHWERVGEGKCKNCSTIVPVLHVTFPNAPMVELVFCPKCDGLRPLI